MKQLPSRAIIERLREFDTALLANTIGFVDPTPAHTWYLGGSIQSVTPTLGPTVGVAITCELDSSTPNNQGDFEVYWRQLEQMQQLGVPTVWVVKTIGKRPDHECVIGDGMGKTLFSVGCVGLVTDGGVRDVTGLLTVPFAAYCRGTTIHHTALRFRGADKAIRIGGITVRTGDVIHANAEGVIKIPPGALAALPDKAVQMRAFEHDVHLSWRRPDLSVADKRRLVGEAVKKYGFADCVTRKK